LRRVSQRGQTWEVTPETKYARTGDGLSVAYQVVGKGPLDLLFVPGYQSNLELNWDLPAYARMLDRLASFSRLIAVDRRGTGLSDRLSPADHPPLETLMDDLRRVMDAVGSEQAALAGFLDGGFLCALFAATYPERTRALVLYGSSASGKWSLDYPWQWKPDRWERFIDDMAAGWGKQDFADQTLRWYAPSAYPDEVTRRWWARYQWLSSSPSSAVAIERLYSQTDVRHLLPSIRVQTLVIHRRDDPAEAVEGARFIVQQIPAAKYVELEGVDSPPWAGDSDILVDEIEEFLTGIRRGPEHDRVLATVLFTDIVDSTRKAAELGDRRWRACSMRMTPRCARSWFGSAEARSTMPVTASSPHSMGRRERSSARARLGPRSATSRLRSGLAFTRARSSAPVTASVGSRCTSGYELPDSPGPVRSSCLQQ
jgi:pimeloyl-ACP methyl ester carboxylesterase